MTEPRKRNLSQKSEMVLDAQDSNILVDTRELFICSCQDRTHESDEIDHWVASNFIKNLRILNHLGQQKILVHLISKGGDFGYSMGIYDTIKDSLDSEAGSEITILAHGYCASMGSIILQAAKTRVLMPSCDVLLHDGSMELSGNWRSVVSEAKWSEKSRERMLDIYTDRCYTAPFWKRERLDKKGVKEWIGTQIDKHQELYFTPEEAVDMGFADYVLGMDGTCAETIEMLRS